MFFARCACSEKHPQIAKTYPHPIMEFVLPSLSSWNIDISRNIDDSWNINNSWNIDDSWNIDNSFNMDNSWNIDNSW